MYGCFRFDSCWRILHWRLQPFEALLANSSDGNRRTSVTDDLDVRHLSSASGNHPPALPGDGYLWLFFGVGVTLACVAGTLPPSDDSCYYEGRRYSPGALDRMGRVEMACIVMGGAASWAHAAY